MKKFFSFTHPKKDPERVVEWTKHEIRKYIKRERAKKRPEGVDFWDFECKFGKGDQEPKTVHIADIPANIDQAFEAKFEKCYVEIVAKPGKRTKKDA